MTIIIIITTTTTTIIIMVMVVMRAVIAGTGFWGNINYTKLKMVI